MPINLSPLAPKSLKKIKIIDGVNVSITHCGLKKNNKDDLVLIKLDSPGDVIGFFTKSKTPGEPIIWNKSIKGCGRVSAILINSGNANVFNGRSGRLSLLKIVKALSDQLNIPMNQIYIASTGVIGEPLDEKKIIKKIPYLISNLRNDSKSWLMAASAIMTTDTYPKTHSVKLSANKNLIINGIAKGSGMIAPDMATMLAFIFTNVDFQKKAFKPIFLEIVKKTFNSISVDGDTSTSDMVLFFSVKGKRNKKQITVDEKREFFHELENLSNRLAEYIVKDGEGASKFIKIKVTGAKKEIDAKNISKSVANSALFKTAMYGSDSNWGRVIMAVGKSNATINPMKLSLKFGKFTLLNKGKRLESKNISVIEKYLRNSELEITIDLGLGKKKWITSTCDLTKEYISINADYRS